MNHHLIPPEQRFCNPNPDELHVPAKTTENTRNTQYTAPWVVYMVRCRDNSLYTGVTTDISRRLAEHNSPKAGARYTRSRQPVVLVYQEPACNRSTALAREHQIKRLSKSGKEQLIRKTDLPARFTDTVTVSGSQHQLTA